MINQNSSDLLLLCSAFIPLVDISTSNLCAFNCFGYEIAARSGTYASAEPTASITFMQ